MNNFKTYFIRLAKGFLLTLVSN